MWFWRNIAQNSIRSWLLKFQPDAVFYTFVLAVTLNDHSFFLRINFP